MIDKNLFLETLHEVAEIAATSGEKIKPEEVHKYFEGMELVYEYLNLPPEAKQAPVTEEEEVTEDAEDIETVEVYSTTDSSKDIQIGADHAAEDEEDDVEFYERNQKKYPEAYVCSQKIVEHIEQHYNCKLSADEKMYLIIYVKRLILEMGHQS
jgi:hypothetical protein